MFKEDIEQNKTGDRWITVYHVTNRILLTVPIHRQIFEKALKRRRKQSESTAVRCQQVQDVLERQLIDIRVQKKRAIEMCAKAHDELAKFAAKPRKARIQFNNSNLNLK